MDPSTWLQLWRTVRFGDTDAAGVMHFHQLFRWCHEAFEESLERFGIEAAEVFPTPGRNAEVALPIVHCSADFRQPLVCGDSLAIELRPQTLDPCRFEVLYTFRRGDPATGNHSTSNAVVANTVVASGLTRHGAITVAGRRRCPLPKPIRLWLEASSVAAGVGPL